jgi:hypothetical protein
MPTSGNRTTRQRFILFFYQNIRDVCNEKAIENMWPPYFSAWDGNDAAIPTGYLPEDHKAPVFKVKTGNTESKEPEY